MPEPNFGARSFGTIATTQTVVRCGVCDAVATRDGWCVRHGKMFGDAAWKHVGARAKKPKAAG